MKTHKEIERKWLISSIDKIPLDLTKAKNYDLLQTYISYTPDIRVRNVNNGESYFLTVKSNMSIDGMIRDECESKISKEEYENLLKRKEGHYIHKRRYTLPDNNGHLFEIDVFLDNLKGLIFLEIEFKNEDEAKKYPQPNWVEREITNDDKYKNHNLAQYGIPTK